MPTSIDFLIIVPNPCTLLSSIIIKSSSKPKDFQDLIIAVRGTRLGFVFTVAVNSSKFEMFTLSPLKVKPLGSTLTPSRLFWFFAPARGFGGFRTIRAIRFS